MNDSSEIRWHAPTHLGGDRSADWYWAVGLVAIAGIALSLYLGDTIFTVLIAIGAICLGILASRHPRECEIIINNEGIVIDHDLHPFRSLHTFWILEDHWAGPRLLLTTTGILHPHIAIGIHEPVTVSQVRAYLQDRLTEEEHHSPGAILTELLGL